MQQQLPVIPKHEETVLQLTIADAEGLALENKSEDGYRALKTGLERVEEAQDGEEWAAELAQRWREALRAYTEKHRIRR